MNSLPNHGKAVNAGTRLDDENETYEPCELT